jgi:hypothetical protein
MLPYNVFTLSISLSQLSQPYLKNDNRSFENIFPKFIRKCPYDHYFDKVRAREALLKGKAQYG